jgi:sugar lactone lactonase YvrE
MTVSSDRKSVLVADPANHRVQAFTRSSVSSDWSQASILRDMTTPVAIALSSDEHTAWITDTATNQIEEFRRDPNSISWTFAAAFGSGLDGPPGTAVTSDGLTLFIADTGNNRISRWGVQ